MDTNDESLRTFWVGSITVISAKKTLSKKSADYLGPGSVSRIIVPSGTHPPIASGREPFVSVRAFLFVSIRGLNYLSFASTGFDSQVRIVWNKPEREDSAD